VATKTGLVGDEEVVEALDGSETAVAAAPPGWLAREAARAANNASPQRQATIASDAAASPIHSPGERLEKSTQS